MSNLKSLIYQKHFLENYSDLEDKKIIPQIEYVLNLNLKDGKTENKLSELLIFLNSRLNLLTNDEFDGICLKMLNKFDEIYKFLLNKLKCSKEESHSNVLLKNIEILNISLMNFYKHFNTIFQNYNDKHKNLIKNIPNFLKIYFKLYEDIYSIPITEVNTLSNFSSQNYLNFHKSYLINIIGLINYFPTLMRSYENKIETIFRKILNNFITKNILISKNNKEFINLLCESYTMFIRLSPDISSKTNNFINLILENLEYYTKVSVPKTIKMVKHLEKIKKLEKNDIFNLDVNSVNNLNQGTNILYILIKILKKLFISFPKNSQIEINFQTIINKIINSLIINKNEIIKNSEYVVEGMNHQDYSLFQEFLINKMLKTLSFLIRNYQPYLNYFNPLIKKLVSYIILNENLYTKYFENYTLILSFFEILIKNGDSLYKNMIEEIIFKFCINNYIDFYVSFLERNDKTIVKIDQNYFKLGKMKSQNKKVNLLELAKKENFNEKLEGYNNNEIEAILISYMKSIYKLS